MAGPVTVDWRYIPASTLGGDTLGYHWVDENHLAFYLLDVTGHGLDSALLAVTITNVIRSGALAGADLRHPDQVLTALNQAFQGVQHGHKYFTIWYGVYAKASRTLSYASGGHPAAIVVAPGEMHPITLPATGPVMGIAPGMLFPAVTLLIPPGGRLFIFSDGVFEIRRDKRAVWDMKACTSHLAVLSSRGGKRHGRAHWRTLALFADATTFDDDFPLIDACFH